MLMKKHIASILGVALISTSAFASKARLQALGEDTYGSLFLDDARNVVLNPAMLNFHKDFVVMEWGATDTGTTTFNGQNLGQDTDQDLATAPKAEGGMFMASGNMIYGLYFGDESNTANGLRTLSMGANAIHESNNVSLYAAGDAGVQWGVKLTHHSFENEQGGADQKSSASRLGVGVISGDVEAFLKMGLTNTAENGTAEFEGKGSFQVGVTYAMGDVDYLLEVRSFQAEDANGDEFKAQYTRIGVAKTYKLNDKATAWASAWYKMDNTENDWTAIAATGETKLTYLPVTMAVEVMAKDWLALRGSIGANVIGTEEDDSGDKETLTTRPLINAGAGIMFGDFVVDGLIGNNTSTGPGAESTAGGVGTLRTDTLMSRVSMTYKF